MKLVPCLLLAGLAVVLFRRHAFGTHTFLGNPDRLNNNLKVLEHYVTAPGTAWNPIELLGYDSLALPYTYPSPISLLMGWLEVRDVVHASGFVSILILAAGGITAYAYCLAAVRDRRIAMVAAILYQFSALFVLKVSQNDLSSAVFVLIPVLLLAVRSIGSVTPATSFATLGALLAFLLHETFLQKAAYALLLAGAYAAYRSKSTRSWMPFGLFAAATAVAVVAAAPRIYWLAIAMGEYARYLPGQEPASFSRVYEVQAVRPWQVLRWLDGGIFGWHFSDATAHRTGINLTEGFLLHTAPAVPVLIVFAILHYRGRILGILRDSRDDASFHFWAFALTTSVVASFAVNHFVYLLFFKVDFIHARILIAGLLPMLVLLSLFLRELDTTACGGGTHAVGKGPLLAALVTGIAAVAAIEWAANRAADRTFDPFGNWVPVVTSVASWRRIAMSTGLVVFLVLATRLDRSILRRSFWFTVLLAVLALQGFRAGDRIINSTFAVDPTPPFRSGDITTAKFGDFKPPTREAIKHLHQELLPEEYRSVFLCDPAIAGGFCAAHLAQRWRLRVADGYYGMGLPYRIGILPWAKGAAPRSLSFLQGDTPPWELLALLNVRQALVPDIRFYRNASRNDPEDPAPSLTIVQNPHRATPRWFFAADVEPTASAQESVAKIFRNGKPSDVERKTFAEAFPGARTFQNGGTIEAVAYPDRIAFRFDRAQSDRFLVVNELPYPGWLGSADGKDVPLYAANVVMRGMVIPAGTTEAELRYVPWPRRPEALACYGFAILALGAGYLLLNRREGRRE